MKAKPDLNTKPLTIINILSMPIVLSDMINHILGTVLFTLLMILGAFVRIYLPFTPVPITLQTLFTLLAGGFLGCVWGVSSIGLYLLLGICGLPVFAGSSGGALYLIGPTGGYLVGFLLATWIVGYMIGSEQNPSCRYILLSFLLASTAMYTLGIYQLFLWTGYDLLKALSIGLVPFIPGDIIKIIIAIVIIKGVKNNHLHKKLIRTSRKQTLLE